MLIFESPNGTNFHLENVSNPLHWANVPTFVHTHGHVSTKVPAAVGVVVVNDWNREKKFLFEKDIFDFDFDGFKKKAFAIEALMKPKAVRRTLHKDIPIDSTKSRCHKQILE